MCEPGVGSDPRVPLRPQGCQHPRTGLAHPEGRGEGRPGLVQHSEEDSPGGWAGRMNYSALHRERLTRPYNTAPTSLRPLAQPKLLLMTLQVNDPESSLPLSGPPRRIVSHSFNRILLTVTPKQSWGAPTQNCAVRIQLGHRLALPLSYFLGCENRWFPYLAGLQNLPGLHRESTKSSPENQELMISVSLPPVSHSEADI